MAIQVHTGYITNTGLNIMFGLIGSNKIFDLDVFKFGIGLKSNFVYQIVEFPDVTFTYNTGTKTFTASSTLPTFSATTYPYIEVYGNVYTIYSATTNSITILETYTGVLTGIVIDGAIATNAINNKVKETLKVERLLPHIQDIGTIGSVKQIMKIDTTTIEIVCEIPENPNIATPEFFDEVYLFNTDILDSTNKLVFVAEMIYGSGVRTGLENNVFNIRISVSNLQSVEDVRYNIDNVSVKKDLETVQLMLLWTLSKKNKSIRDIDNKLNDLETYIADFAQVDTGGNPIPGGFSNYITGILSNYLYSRIQQKYQVAQNPLFTLDINLYNPANLRGTVIQDLNVSLIADIRNIIGIVPITAAGTKGYPSNYMFYISNGSALSHTANKMYCVDLNASTTATPIFVTLPTAFSTLTFASNEIIAPSLLTEIFATYN